MKLPTDILRHVVSFNNHKLERMVKDKNRSEITDNYLCMCNTIPPTEEHYIKSIIKNGDIIELYSKESGKFITYAEISNCIDTRPTRRHLNKFKYIEMIGSNGNRRERDFMGYNPAYVYYEFKNPRPNRATKLLSFGKFKVKIPIKIDKYTIKDYQNQLKVETLNLYDIIRTPYYRFRPEYSYQVYLGERMSMNYNDFICFVDAWGDGGVRKNENGYPSYYNLNTPKDVVLKDYLREFKRRIIIHPKSEVVKYLRDDLVFFREHPTERFDEAVNYYKTHNNIPLNIIVF